MAKQKEIKKEEFKDGVSMDRAVFGVWNYRLMIVGLVMVVVGFILMVGGESPSPDVFNEEMFSFRRITLSTIFILAGFVVEIFAIMMKKNVR